MQLGYCRPFSFQVGPKPETKIPETKIVGIRHGVTEITLSDGRLVRATLHVTSVNADPQKAGTVDLSFNVVAEFMNAPATLIHDVHETIQ